MKQDAAEKLDKRDTNVVALNTNTESKAHDEAMRAAFLKTCDDARKTGRLPAPQEPR